MSNTIYGGTTATPTPLVLVEQTFNPESKNALSGKAVADVMGDIETALDTLIADQEAIIAIQNALMGGGGE